MIVVSCSFRQIFTSSTTLSQQWMRTWAGNCSTSASAATCATPRESWSRTSYTTSRRRITSSLCKMYVSAPPRSSFSSCSTSAFPVFPFKNRCVGINRKCCVEQLRHTTKILVTQQPHYLKAIRLPSFSCIVGNIPS